MIPVVTLDTSRLPPAEQFAEWARHSNNSRLSAVHGGSFLAQGDFWTLGPVHISHFRLDAFVSDRDRELVNTTATGHVQVIALYEGWVRLEAKNLDQTYTAPDIFVRDFARPSRATAGPIRFATPYFERDFLEEATGPFTAQGLLTPSPETAMLAASLATLIQHLPSSDESSAGFYARTLRDLFAAALTGRCNTEPSGIDADRLSKAKAYIAGRPPGSVSVDDLVDDLGMSRSVLYEMFRPFGGVIAYDRLRRLRALYQDLNDSTERRSIAELGAVHGFFDKASLSRSFRNTFGCSLTEVRQRSQPEPASSSVATSVDKARDAIERLG